jgi:GDP-L-fucose synthase
MLSNKVLVTGGNGFFGRYICKELLLADFEVISTYHDNVKDLIPGVIYEQCDLEISQDVNSFIYWTRPDYVIHAAGYNGGIKFNMLNQYDIYSKNITMANNLFNALFRFPPKKIVSIVASCAYDSSSELLLPEQILEGEPNHTVACHGYAKRHLQLLSRFMWSQYGLEAVTACATTLYGPGDSVDPNKTKVMMALIKKFVDAKNNNTDVNVWGTGEAKRQFIFAKDAAKALKRAIFEYNDSYKPVHICGNDGDISIKDLCEVIKKVVDFKGQVIFDTSHPDGQMKKELVPSREMNGLTYTKLEDGIRETVQWYQSLE